jgi:hypothetical protein
MDKLLCPVYSFRILPLHPCTGFHIESEVHSKLLDASSGAIRLKSYLPVEE